MASISTSTRAVKTKAKQRTQVVLGIVAVAVLLFPVYWILNISLQSKRGVIGSTLYPRNFSLEGYQAAFGDQLGNLTNSLVVAVGVVAVSLLIAAPASFVLANMRSRWVNIILFAVLISQMIPSISIANSLFVLYNQVGLVDSYIGLILADATHSIPFSILILRSFMVTIPRSIVEAAEVDGAGVFRVFARIVLPISKNALVTASVFSFLFAWSDFIFGLTLTTSEKVKPVTLGIYQYLGAETIEWPSVMATSAMSSIPAILLLLVAQRYVSAGVTGGAVK